MNRNFNQFSALNLDSDNCFFFLIFYSPSPFGYSGQENLSTHLKNDSAPHEKKTKMPALVKSKIKNTQFYK